MGGEYIMTNDEQKISISEEQLQIQDCTIEDQDIVNYFENLQNVLSLSSLRLFN